MLYASIARPQQYGSEVASFNKEAAEGVKGVRAVARIPSGIAVCAETIDAAWKGRNALNVKWQDPKYSDIKYVQGYALEYLWCGEKQDEETYTYGSRLNHPINQIEEAVERYVQEQRDRQVTLVIRLPEDIRKSIDTRRHEPPCLSLIDTEILEGKMHLTCYFRSWDAYAGLPANIAGLQLFNEAFVKEINSRGNLSLETGKLMFHSKNCHIYQRLNKLVEDLLKPKSSSKTQRVAKVTGASEEAVPEK